eukprot:Em0039g12a
MMVEVTSLIRQDIAKFTTGGEELPIVNNVKAAVKLSSIVESYLGSVTVPEHSFIVVEQLISQDILGLQQQGLAELCQTPVSTAPLPDTEALLQLSIWKAERERRTKHLRGLDDVLIHLVNEELHKSHLEQAFQRLREAGLTLRGSKCQIGMAQTMGHSLSMDTGTDASKVGLGAQDQIGHKIRQASCLPTNDRPRPPAVAGTKVPYHLQWRARKPVSHAETISKLVIIDVIVFVDTTCPGDITYTCVLSSSAPLGVVTVWSGSAFQCPPTNHISLTQKALGTVQTLTPRSCGSLSAVTTNVTSTCYTSVLTIPAVRALNGTTVLCQDGNTGAVVGSGTVNLRMPASPGPVGNMTVTSTSVDQLTVTWTPPTTGGVPTGYNVAIIDSSSPVVIADNGSPVYTHTFTGLVSDTLYTISVVAINCAGASNAVQHHRRTLAGPPEMIQMISVLKPINILCHFKVSWIPVGGSVTKYNVNVENDGIIIGHGSTSCTTSPCVYVQQVSALASSYNISVASINGDGSIGPANSTIINGTVENFIDASVSYHGPSNAVIDCKFLNNQSFYCVVCCSTDPSVPPDSSVYNISTTRGTEVTVSLQGLTSGQMY